MSQLDSPQTAQSPAPTSQPGAGPVQKQRFNVYTMMLILSTLFLLIGCVLLYRELSQFGEFGAWWKAS